MTLSPWTANEKWEYWTDPNTGKRFAKVSGRTRVPDSIKTRAWMIGNDYEQKVTDADAQWYHGTTSNDPWPEYKRIMYWNYFRNPLQNARMFVWGWADRNYVVDVLEGNPDPMVVQRNDVTGADGKPELGYQKSRLTMDDGTTATFTSFCSDKLVWYAGIQPSGFYGCKFNIHKS